MSPRAGAVRPVVQRVVSEQARSAIGGFSNFDPELHRPASIWVREWCEVCEPLPAGAARAPAARRMGCAAPFCNEGCPLGHLIPEWDDLSYRDDWPALSERLHASQPNFPDFICPVGCAREPATVEGKAKRSRCAASGSTSA